MQGAEIEGKGAYLKYVTEPVLRQAQQPSKVTWLLSDAEVQQLSAYETPLLFKNELLTGLSTILPFNLNNVNTFVQTIGFNNLG
jgi:hypothetical protein